MTVTVILILSFFLPPAMLFAHVLRKRILLQKEKEKKLLAEAAAQAEEDIEKWIKEQEAELEQRINLASLPQTIDRESIKKVYSLDKYAFREELISTKKAYSLDKRAFRD